MPPYKKVFQCTIIMNTTLCITYLYLLTFALFQQYATIYYLCIQESNWVLSRSDIHTLKQRFKIQIKKFSFEKSHCLPQRLQSMVSILSINMRPRKCLQSKRFFLAFEVIHIYFCTILIFMKDCAVCTSRLVFYKWSIKDSSLSSTIVIH